MRIKALLLAAAVFLGTATTAAATTGGTVRPNDVATNWSTSLYTPHSGDTYHVADTFPHSIAIVCGLKSTALETGFGVRHVKEGHGYDSNTDACIRKIITYGVPTTASGTNNSAYKYVSGGEIGWVIYTRFPAVTPVSETYSVVTAYLQGWPAGNAQWDNWTHL